MVRHQNLQFEHNMQPQNSEARRVGISVGNYTAPSYLPYRRAHAQPEGRHGDYGKSRMLFEGLKPKAPTAHAIFHAYSLSVKFL